MTNEQLPRGDAPASIHTWDVGPDLHVTNHQVTHVFAYGAETVAGTPVPDQPFADNAIEVDYTDVTPSRLLPESDRGT